MNLYTTQFCNQPNRKLKTKKHSSQPNDTKQKRVEANKPE